MWNIFNTKKTPSEKMAELIFTVGVGASLECSEKIEKLFLTKPDSDKIIWDNLAFYTSLAMSELMRLKGGTQKQDYDRIYDELRTEIGKVGIKRTEFFVYASATRDESFRNLTLDYYQSNIDNITPPDELDLYAKKYHLEVPTDNPFATTCLMLLIRLLKNTDLQSIGKPEVENMAVTLILKIIDAGIKKFTAAARAA